MDGNKVIEIKSPSINKGIAAHQWLQNVPYDFLLIAGDDQTDEDMFNFAPDDAWTIKVGRQSSQARFNLKNVNDMRALLMELDVSVDKS